MAKYFPGAPLLVALCAGILPPGDTAYFGAYVVLGVGALGLVAFGWPERAGFTHPVSLAILAAIVLLCATLPFVYRGPADLMAPVFVLPILATIGLGLLAMPGQWLPTPLHLASLCLLAAFVALAAGAYEYFFLEAGRVGLGNNPIHYASLAAMSGGIALVGVVSTTSPSRYLFLLGPIFGVGAAVLSGSRGPLAGAVAMAGSGALLLTFWFWRDRIFRFAALAALLLSVVVVAYLLDASNDRVTRLLTTAFNIFRFTGGSDDIRAALYASAIHVLQQSPVFGVGAGQIMHAAQQLYPQQAEVFTLDNLHADWANFAVMAGGFGLLAWLLLLFAPLLLLANRFVRADRSIVLGVVLLVIGQAVLGISNAMFGILPQTTLYALILGYMLAWARSLNYQCAANG